MKRLISLFVMLTILALPLVGLAESTGVSLTTGLPTDKEYKPITTTFDNASGARPQKGIGSADVVYELVVQSDNYTRYLAVFNDELPETVEAVRSLRIMMADLYLDWGGALVHWGQQEPAATNPVMYLERLGVTTDRRFNGLTGDANFYRDSSRNAPHNVVAELQKLNDRAPDDVEARGPLKFSADAYTAKGEDVHSFGLSYRKNCRPSYEYNADEGVYYRFYNDSEFKDGDTGEQITCSNIIVMTTAYSWYDGDGTMPLVELYGSNSCDYFVDGKHFTGTWTRDSSDSSTIYLDDEGNEVMFKPGKTYIQLMLEDKEITYN